MSCPECACLEYRCNVLHQQNEELRRKIEALKQIVEPVSHNLETTLADAAIQILALEAELAEKCPKVQAELLHGRTTRLL